MHLPFQYLRLQAVLEATGFASKSTLYLKIREKKFPAPDRLDDGASRWRSTLVAQWLIEQAARADAQRAERAKVARERGQRMNQARGKAKVQEAT